MKLLHGVHYSVSDITKHSFRFLNYEAYILPKSFFFNEALQSCFLLNTTPAFGRDHLFLSAFLQKTAQNFSVLLTSQNHLGSL